MFISRFHNVHEGYNVNNALAAYRAYVENSTEDLLEVFLNAMFPFIEIVINKQFKSYQKQDLEDFFQYGSYEVLRLAKKKSFILNGDEKWYFNRFWYTSIKRSIMHGAKGHFGYYREDKLEAFNCVVKKPVVLDNLIDLKCDFELFMQDLKTAVASSCRLNKKYRQSFDLMLAYILDNFKFPKTLGKFKLTLSKKEVKFVYNYIKFKINFEVYLNAENYGLQSDVMDDAFEDFELELNQFSSVFYVYNKATST